jgi:hypothetical protein
MESVMQVLDISKEDLIHQYKCADQLYAQACKGSCIKTVEDAKQLREDIAVVIVNEFQVPDQNAFNRMVYTLN